MSRARIEPARPGDRRAVEDLLRLCGLPLDGVEDRFDRFLVAVAVGPAGPEREVAGCVGIEVHGRAAVLRSLAVRPADRGSGLGRALMLAALESARRAGCGEIYLLTYTIERMAGRIGFEKVGRESVSPAALASREFSANACAAATVMRRALESDPV